MDEVFKLLRHGESWQALKHQGNDATLIGWFPKACLLRTVTSSNFIFLNRHRMQKNGLSSLKLRHVSRKEMVICLLGKRWKYILRGNDTYSNVYVFYYMIQNNEQMPRSTVHIRESIYCHILSLKIKDLRRAPAPAPRPQPVQENLRSLAANGCYRLLGEPTSSLKPA